MAGGWRWVTGPGHQQHRSPVRVGFCTSRRELTTSTIVVRDSTALLVDPSWEPDELCWIADSLAELGIDITAGFATHAHHDHVLWHPRFGTVPRWASSRVAHQAADHRTELLEALGAHWPADLAHLAGRLTAVDGTELPWEVTKVEMITHDAHAPGHTALWIPEAKVLIAGDMLSDVELPLLEGSSLDDYARGLAALRPFANRANVVIPGHGHPAIGNQDAAARCVADQRYLHALAAGRDPADPRQNHPGMREAHQANIFRVVD
jgi:hydroxyacylglutathione hydrolase